MSLAFNHSAISAPAHRLPGRACQLTSGLSSMSVNGSIHRRGAAVADNSVGRVTATAITSN